MSGEASKNTNLGPKTSETELLPEPGSNSLYNIIKEIEFITYLGSINTLTDKEGGGQLLPEPGSNYKIIGTIFGNYDFNRVVIYFINHGASTSSILISRLGIPEKSIFNYIRQLGQWGLIFPVKKARVGFTSGNRESGRIPDVWQTPDATNDQVLEASQLHRKLKFPKYARSEKLAQSILNDYFLAKHREELTFSDLKEMVKATGIPKAEVLDETNFVAKYLEEAGKIIWRGGR